MAERIVSPAVFTNEIDSTYLIEGIGAIGGAIVGPFTKGPAYSPTVVRSVAQLEALFGVPQGIYYQPFTAREYLLEQGVVTIVRTGALEGWLVENALMFKAEYVSGSANSDVPTLDEIEEKQQEVKAAADAKEQARIDNDVAEFNAKTELQIELAAELEALQEKRVHMLNHGIEEGDIPTDVVIGVLANTLKEKEITGVPIAKKDLASPAITSVGFRGSMLIDTDGGEKLEIEVDKNKLELQLMLRTQFGLDANGDPNPPSDLGDVDYSDTSTTRVAEKRRLPYTFNLNPAHPNSLQNVFGRAPQKNSKPGYFTSYFESSQKLMHDLIVEHDAKYKISVHTSNEFLDFSKLNEDDDMDGIENKTDTDVTWYPYDGAGKGIHACRPAHTPWIMSQEISGSRYPLFRFCTRSFGRSANSEIKIGIYNVKTPGTLDGTDYGTFSVIVRGFGDNDKTQDVIEDFRDVSLDPLSSRYLPRVIGDRFTYINEMGKIIERGDYPNFSDWIRVDMPTDSTPPTQSMPYGHEAYRTPFGVRKDVVGLPIDDLPEPRYSYASQYERVPGRYFNGAVFNEASPDGVLVVPPYAKDTLELFRPIPDKAEFAGVGFYMDVLKPKAITTNIDGMLEFQDFEPIPTNPTSFQKEADARRARRFLVGFQGGDDGHSPVQPIMLGADIRSDNVQGFDCSRRFSIGTQAYDRAFKALSNQDEFDINLLVTPGLSLDLHRSVINMGVDLCETREDCFYILDCVQANGQPGMVDEAVVQASTIDSNYAATYYPWVKIIDPATNSLQTFPPSAIMPAVYAANDKTAAEWYAPAGLNRGGLEQAVSVLDRLTFAERDTLYEGKVNPIAQFPGQGIVAFGQKTLQRRASALDRINVRRLLITLKKFIASSSRYLLFEQNTAATRNKFLAIVNPYLEAVQQRQGLYAFNVVMDESNNTPDLIDRNILYGQIFLQPARAVEFIILDFNLTATGASFG